MAAGERLRGRRGKGRQRRKINQEDDGDCNRLMIHWRQIVLALSAHNAVGPHLAGPAPAWVFSATGDRVLWCNVAGAARFGEQSFAALANRRFAQTNPLRTSLQRLRRHLRQTPGLSRLKLPGGGISGAQLCQCQSVRDIEIGGNGQASAIFVVAQVNNDRWRPQPSAEQVAIGLAEFFAAADTCAGIVDPAGQLIATREHDSRGEIRQAEHPPALADAAHRPMSVDIGEGAPDWRLVLTAVAAEAGQAGSRSGQSDNILAATETVSDAAPPAIAGDRTAPGAAPDSGAGASAGESSDSDIVSNPPPRSPFGEIDADNESLRLRRALNESAGPSDLPADRQFDRASGQPGTTKNAVRFLWQTDAAHRILFVSPGLGQTVGRSAEIVGEIWADAADRLRLDPAQKVAQALVRHDTWSGLTVWWPVGDKAIVIPAELTALPVFSIDQSFQGFRGFGVLKPAEAITAAEFDARYGAPEGPSVSPGDLTAPDRPANVVPLHGGVETPSHIGRLTRQEHTAFEEIAADLAERVRARLERPDDFSAADPAPPSPSGADTDSGGDAEINEPAESIAGEIKVENHSTQLSAPTVSKDPAAAMASPSTDDHDRIHELTAILNTATDGVLIINGEGRVEELNSSAQALFGIETAAVKGRSFTDLLLPESWQTALDYLSGLRGSGVASVLNEGREVAGKCGDGTIPLFMTMGRISDSGAGRFCAVLRDITQWKHTEEDLVSARHKAEEASSQKSDFLARVSHEIRTPLNAIIGFADVMIDERFGALGNSRYREYLRDIRTSGEHVVALVNDLLDISKIEAGKIDLNFSAVPLNDLVSECMSLMQPLANKNRVVLRASLVADIPSIVADQKSLRQIVLNLLSNSIKFTRAGGQVIASTSLTESGEAELRVRDNGEGMSTDELVRAMEPFRQLSTAAIGSEAGTGLGLPLTKALVEANRARFSIESARGEGTIVKVTFPPTRVLSE